MIWIKQEELKDLTKMAELNSSLKGQNYFIEELETQNLKLLKL